MALARRRPCHEGGAVSSAVLYLAIVALWAVVLVPMWLRRDADAARPAHGHRPHRGHRLTALRLRRAHDGDRPGDPDGPADDRVDDRVDARPGGAPDDRPAGRPGDRLRPRRRSRGAVIARRRRRTWILSLLVLAAAGCGAARLVPYWTALPPAGLLAGHLSLLRVAAGIDAERRETAALARAAERARARAAREAREAAEAEIIDLMARNRARDVFDQYAPDELRVVGD
jgi:hypothetical protein